MANRSKPSRLRILNGNPGHRPLNANEPSPAVGRPKRPKFLRGTARKEWDSIAAELEGLGVLTRVDGVALAAYCQCFKRWMEAEAEIEAMGVLVKIEEKDDAGVFHLKAVKKNPAVTVAKGVLQELRAYLTEFGLTPCSRTKLHVNPKPKKEVNDGTASPLRKFLDSKNAG